MIVLDTHTHTHTNQLITYYKYVVLILFAVLFSSSLFAQSYTEQQDSIFQHLDKSKINTGVLYDRVYPWAALTQEYPSDFSVNYHYVQQAWYELELATYDTVGLLTSEKAQQIIAFNQSKDIDVTVGFIDYLINYISTNAYSDSILFYGPDSLLYENEGEPYDTRLITFPLISTEQFFGDSISIYFDPNLIFTNISREINHIDIHIDKNNTIRLLPGDLIKIDISYLQEGPLKLEIEGDFDPVEDDRLRDLTMDNSWIYEMVAVPRPLEYNGNVCFTDDTLKSGDDLRYSGYEYDYSSLDNGFGGVQSVGEYRILHRQINNSWDDCKKDVYKPIIIIDGFDPKDERKIMYSNTGPGIWNMLEYGNVQLGTNQHLGDQLRKLGYDVILLNFPDYIVEEYVVAAGLTMQDLANDSTLVPMFTRNGGADFIERNAMVLVKLIQDINYKLNESESSEEIVIVGPSMGGQIARYALAYMEKQDSLGVNNMNHNTRLFISFDSPHLGANIPLALQVAIYEIGYKMNKFDAKDAYNYQLNSIAAQQMLIEQLNYRNRTEVKHQIYYGSFEHNGLNNSQGWPINLRKVALINGTDKGIKTGDEKYNILDLKVGLINPLLVVKSYNLPKSNETISQLFRVYGAVFDPFTGTVPISYYHGIPFPFTSFTNHNTNGSMDIVPGGTFGTALVLKNMIAKSISKVEPIVNLYVNNIQNNHTFIPTVSSLGFKNYDFDWSDSFNNEHLVCNGRIPFDNYYAPDTNESHVKITSSSAKWVLNEILNDNQLVLKNSIDSFTNDFSPICINGERIIYHNYFLSPCMEVRWELEPNSAFVILNSDDYHVELKAISNTENEVVRCIIKTSVQDSLVKEYYLEAGVEPSYIDVISELGLVKKAVIGNYRPEVYSYFWKMNNGPWLPANGPEYFHTFFQFSTNNTSMLYLKYSDVCGTNVDSIDISLVTWVSTVGAFDNTFSITVDPNPTNDYWHLSFTHAERKEISLTTIDGRILFEKTTNDVDVQVQAKELPAGMYLLRVKYNDIEKNIKLIRQ